MENSVRKVLVVSTSSGTKEIESNATVWSGLKQDLRREGITFDGMKAVVGSTKGTLEHEESLLPEGDFELFLLLKKSKSGADRKAIYASIKELIQRDGNKAKDYFNSGENYTRKKTDVLERELSNYTGQPISPTASEEKPKVTKAQAKAVVADKASVQIIVGITPEQAAELRELGTEIVEGFTDSIDDDDEEVYYDYDEQKELQRKFDNFFAIVSALPVNGVQVSAPITDQPKVETVEEKAAREAAEKEERLRKEKEEKDRLLREQKERELRDLAKGFNDVR